MSKNRSALKIIAEIILMIVIFGIAMLFTHRGNINDKKPRLKKDRYRVEVIQENGHRAWSSPIWTSIK